MIATSFRRAAMAAILVLICSLPDRAQKRSGDAADDRETAEIHDFRLSMDLIERGAAAGADLRQLLDKDPEQKERWSRSFHPEPPIDQMVRNVETKCPEAAAAIRNHGLTVRQFLLLRLALVLDVYFVMANKEDGTEQYPRGAILPENKALIEHNLERIRELSEDLEFDQN